MHVNTNVNVVLRSLVVVCFTNLPPSSTPSNEQYNGLPAAGRGDLRQLLFLGSWHPRCGFLHPPPPPKLILGPATLKPIP
jgi:hypothetical protein